MIRYILKRLLMMIPILLAMTICIFTLMYFVPGDPAIIAAGGENVSVEQLDQIRENMGLNDPYIVQLGRYMYNVYIKFDFGNSYTYGTPVGPEIFARFWHTFAIAFVSLIVMIVVGVPVGVTSATHANKLLDRVAMFFTLLCNSMPTFWLALLLLLFFSARMGWLPSYGIGTVGHYILPCMATALGAIAGIARQTRSSMLEVIRSDYITTARSKGLSNRRVIYGHALPNALIPIITVCGNQFGRMLGGLVLVETIFAIPGISVYMMDGIKNRDYTVVQGCLIVMAFLFSMLMLIADLVFAFVDPRIRAQYVRPKKKKVSAGENHA